MNRNCVLATWRAAALITAFVPSCLLMAGDVPVVFRFESDVETWKPRAETIHVLHEKQGAADSAGCLRVRGRIEGGWNYAVADPQPIQPGQLYRLTTQVRVDKLGPETPPPYLKCECVGAARTSSLSQVHTSHYDTNRLGT